MEQHHQHLDVTEEHQLWLYEAKPAINQKLNKDHFSYHVNSVKHKKKHNGTSYHFKVRSNDGELYHINIFHPSEEGAKRQVVSAQSLYTNVQSNPSHEQRIKNYTATINQVYKANNSTYRIVSIQQQTDDPNNQVYKVEGKQDGKVYKLRLQKANS